MNFRNKENSRTSLDASQYNLAREVHFRNPFTAAMRQLLVHKVFARGFDLYFDTKESSMTPFVRKAFNALWSHIGTQILDEIFTLGVVPYRWQFDVDSQRMLPHIIAAGLGASYDIQLVVDPRERSTLEFYDWSVSKLANPMDKPDRSVHFLEHFNFDPLRSGDLTAPAASLGENFVFVEQLRHSAKIAEQRRAAPLLITETEESALVGNPNDRKTLPSEQQQNHTLQRGIQQERAELMGQRIREETRDLTARLHAGRYQEMLLRMAQAFGPKETHVSARQHPQEGGFFVPLNPGHKLVRQVVPEHNGDLLNLLERWEEEQSTAYGIPRALIIGDTVSRSSNTSAELTVPAFVRTVTVWKNRLSSVLTGLFQESIRRTREHLLLVKKRTAGSKRKFAAMVALDDEISQMFRMDETKVVLSLIHNEITDKENLAYFYVADVISWQQFQSEKVYALPLNNVEREQWLKEAKTSTDPLSQHDKKLLLQQYLAASLGKDGADGKTAAAAAHFEFHEQQTVEKVHASPAAGPTTKAKSAQAQNK